MPSELTKTFTISISDCDPRGHLRPSAILVIMQELAEIHAATLGFPRDMLIESGMCWILYRQHIEIREYPTFGDEIRITTWPGAIDGPLFPRHFLMEKADGTPMGAAATSWILMNIHTRRPMRPSALPGTVPPNLERTPPLPLPAMLRITDAAPVMDRPVRYSDLDVNGHMNNTRYIDWICDALDLSEVMDRGLASFQINYISEGKPGEMITLSKVVDEGKTFIQGKRTEDGQTVFDSFVTFL